MLESSTGKRRRRRTRRRRRSKRRRTRRIRGRPGYRLVCAKRGQGTLGPVLSPVGQGRGPKVFKTRIRWRPTGKVLYE